MGCFDTHETVRDLFANYRATVTFRDRLVAGTPKDPKVMEGWLRSKAGITADTEVQRAIMRTLAEMGKPVPAEPDNMPAGTAIGTYADLTGAVNTLIDEDKGNGFKQDHLGLYMESRWVKAGLKESVNILYAGQKWGKTGKGPKSFTAERVFVSPDHVRLGRAEPDGIDLFIGHPNGPRGVQSTLTPYEYVERATVVFYMRVLRDEIDDKHWPPIWVLWQELGMGAMRSQGFGRFDITNWESVGYDTFAEAAIGDNSPLPWLNPMVPLVVPVPVPVA